jgi:predicted lysophospholipase L1 biosynthesis ABC-type transport system permease subunit
MFGATGAIGRQLMFQIWDRPPARTFTVVGIARDTDTGRLMWRDGEVAYVPLAQHYEPNLFVVARTSGKPAAAVRVLQNALRQADPDLSTGTAGPASMLLAGHMVAARTAGTIAGALGLLTLVLATIGLYGIQTHGVALRTPEIGVRMALGASVAQIQRMILSDGYRPVIQGVVLGTVFGVIARMGLRALITDRIQVFDPLALTLVPIPLFVAAFLACYVPARKASRVDPNVALRHL